MRARKQRPWVVGIDASLTCTGLVAIPPDWDPAEVGRGDWRSVEWAKVEIPGVPREDCLSAHEFEEYRVDRFGQIAQRVGEFIWKAAYNEPVRAFVEGYAFAASSASVTKLAELGGVVRWSLYTHVDLRLVVEPVTSQQARQVLLGKAPRKGAKKAAQDALKAAGAPFGDSGDVCDAFAVAGWGRTECGMTALCLAR